MTPGPASVSTRKPWTQEEDSLLRVAVQIYGAYSEKWAKIASYVPGRTNKNCRKRWFHSLDPKLKKGPWTEEDDELLRQGVEKYKSAWSKIAETIPGRTDDQCAKRWKEGLDPEIDKSNWTQAEDALLLAKYDELGSQWQKISEHFPGRPGLHCRNRWRKIQRSMNQKKDTPRKTDRKKNNAAANAGASAGASASTTSTSQAQVATGSTTTAPTGAVDNAPSATIPPAHNQNVLPYYQNHQRDVFNQQSQQQNMFYRGMQNNYDDAGTGLLHDEGPDLSSANLYNHNGYGAIQNSSIAQGNSLSHSQFSQPQPPPPQQQQQPTQPQMRYQQQQQPNVYAQNYQQPVQPYEDNSQGPPTQQPPQALPASTSAAAKKRKKGKADVSPKKSRGRKRQKATEQDHTQAQTHTHTQFDDELPSLPPPLQVQQAQPVHQAPLLPPQQLHQPYYPRPEQRPMDTPPATVPRSQKRKKNQQPTVPPPMPIPEAPPTPADITPNEAQYSALGVTVIVDPHVRAYGCALRDCGAAFENSSGLFYHMKSVHEDDFENVTRPYRCALPGCNKQYKNINGLRYHIVDAKGTSGHQSFVSEEVVDPEEEAQKPYKCQYPGCRKSYKNPNGLQYHIQHAHQGAPPAQLSKAVRQASSVKKIKTKNGLLQTPSSQQYESEASPTMAITKRKKDSSMSSMPQQQPQSAHSNQPMDRPMSNQQMYPQQTPTHAPGYSQQNFQQPQSFQSQGSFFPTQQQLSQFAQSQTPSQQPQQPQLQPQQQQGTPQSQIQVQQPAHSQQSLQQSLYNSPHYMQTMGTLGGSYPSYFANMPGLSASQAPPSSSLTPRGSISGMSGMSMNSLGMSNIGLGGMLPNGASISGSNTATNSSGYHGVGGAVGLFNNNPSVAKTKHQPVQPQQGPTQSQSQLSLQPQQQQQSSQPQQQQQQQQQQFFNQAFTPSSLPPLQQGTTTDYLNLTNANYRYGQHLPHHYEWRE